jgi:hypothetical protein
MNSNDWPPPVLLAWVRAVGSRAVQHGSRRRALQGVGARSGARDPGRTNPGRTRSMRARARIPHFARDAPRSPTTRPVLIRAGMNRRNQESCRLFLLCRHPTFRQPRFAWGLRLVPTRVAVEVGLCERTECEHVEALRLIEEHRGSAVWERAAIRGLGSPRPRMSRSPRRGGIFSSGSPSAAGERRPRVRERRHSSAHGGKDRVGLVDGDP